MPARRQASPKWQRCSAKRSAASFDDFERHIELEGQNRFGLDPDIALRRGLRHGSAARPDRTADGGAFSTAQKCADDAADGGAAADEFRRALVGAESLTASLFEIRGAQRVLPPVD